VDEASLALIADAWSRTYRSKALTFAASNDAVTTRHGLRIRPDQVAADWPGGRRLRLDEGHAPAQALDHALQAIERRYGRRTADVVAMQLEYPRSAAL
jgi:hypothetical protein